ncbi:MAG: type II toxin-antitoxin system HicA family toxin [Nanoarchaeota archaeon]
MSIKYTPMVRKIIKILEKKGFYVARMKGSHIAINKNPSLIRPIIIPNKKELSIAVRKNLIKELEESGFDTSEIKKIF